MDHDLLTHILKGPSPDQIRKWMAQMASGINALHDMGLLHRDLKPENVLVDHAGCARIADLGAAYVHPYPLSPSEVYSSEVVGTRQYMAPEVVALCGARADEARAMMYGVGVDWWALGCMFFDMLSGTSLFADHADLKAYLSAFGKGHGLAFIRERLTAPATPLEEDLLLGLLHAQEDRRYTFKHVAHAGYFWRDGHAYSEFEGLARRARAARSLYRPERAQYQNLGGEGEGEGAEVLDLFESTNQAMRIAEDKGAQGERGSGYGLSRVWDSFAWISPKGMWSDWAYIRG
ncbi:kinase-like protein [Dentipellis sp. KUC8613]|nr:kinase-like protein [Dentipellis sp. KUC8613]